MTGNLQLGSDSNEHTRLQFTTEEGMHLKVKYSAVLILLCIEHLKSDLFTVLSLYCSGKSAKLLRQIQV